MSNRKFYVLAIMVGLIVIALLSWFVPAPIFQN